MGRAPVTLSVQNVDCQYRIVCVSYVCPTWVSSPPRQGLNCSQMHIHNPFCWRMTCHPYRPVWSSPSPLPPQGLRVPLPSVCYWRRTRNHWSLTHRLSQRNVKVGDQRERRGNLRES